MKSENIAFLAINSNSTEDMEEVKKHAREHGLTFPILKDKNNVIADKFNAQVTPEIFVIDKDSRILYHGRIDDERRESDVKSADLKRVLDEILANKPVNVNETKAFGCSIKRVSK